VFVVNTFDSFHFLSIPFACSFIMLPMITHMQIRNFAIVDTLDIELRHGMTVLTGETGAGNLFCSMPLIWRWVVAPTAVPFAMAASVQKLG
jgi:hypothetical protein